MKAKTLSIITAIIVTIYMLFKTKLALPLRLSNALFITGFIYLCIALIFYIHNVGFFKSVKYHLYRKKEVHPPSKNRDENIGPQNEDDENRPMNFHEFYEERYKKPWSSAIFYKFSIPLLLAALIIALIF